MPQWPATNLSLDCFPSVPASVGLPWDAADEYLLRELPATDENAAPSPWLILNDRHGALATATEPAHWWADSYCARVATERNCRENNRKTPIFIDTADLTSLNGTAPSTPVVLIRIPKQKDQLADQLHAIGRIAPNARVLLAGMAKHIPIPLLNWLEDVADTYRQGPVVKKARLVEITGLSGFEATAMKHYDINDFRFDAPAGVFCSDRPDPGAQVMLQHLPTGVRGVICDLGCGNGILTAHLSRANPDATMIATDDSQLAANAAKANMERNGIHADVRHGNILSAVDEPLDLIVCNPPFHDGHKQLTNIAEDMFRQAQQQLNKGGRLMVVANRHLPYSKTLNRLFKRVELISNDRRFNVYDCYR